MQTSDSEDDLEPEYDFPKMDAMPRGRFAPGRRAAANVILLDPEVARAFPSDEAVNEALKLVMALARVPARDDGPAGP